MKIQLSLFADSVMVLFALKKVHRVSRIDLLFLDKMINAGRGLPVKRLQATFLIPFHCSIYQQEAA
ncbi:hypothetical protein B9T23_16445 [Acinetobacter terrae]|jgi:hypothetical protein|nr:hypothetical protein B9T23_16445 [Acinetobacter terrae]